MEVLRTNFPDAPPTVIDLDDAIPDRLFTDEAHLSKNGAHRLSKLVAERLRANAPAHDSPQADVSRSGVED
jgi:hypothetical protein